ncbi:MAG TPA: hypothetical protein VHO90_08120, partial [Bacteroidales bacterium]|nr:hypothetical protein [Bacteroidales bacterium]
PGIAHAGEIAPGLFVRGLSDGNTGIYVNNTRVLGLSHLLSIYPVFNSDAVKSMTLYKDDAEAAMHGSLHSYLYISTETKVQNDLKANAELGLLSSKVGVKLPLMKDKLSVTGNLRRSYFDIITDFYNSRNKDKTNYSLLPDYRFLDGDVSVQFEAGKGGHFQISYFGSDDKFRMDSKEFDMHSSWKNNVGSINWQNDVRKHLHIEAHAGASNYNTSVDFKNAIIRHLYNRNAVEQVNVSLSTDYFDKWKLETGAGFDNHHLTIHSSWGYNNSEMSGSEIATSSTLFYEYLSGTFAPVSFLKIKTILRGEHYRSRYNSDHLVPSVSCTWTMPSGSLLGRWSQQYQYQHMYTPLGMNLPMKIWYPSDSASPAEASNEYNLSYFKSLKCNWSIRAGIYYIILKDQIEFLEGNYLNSLDFKTDIGRGTSKGFEISLRKTGEHYMAEMSYSFGESKRRFPNINQGNAFRPPFDIPHKLDIAFNWTFSDHWDVSLNQFIQSGMMMTLPTGIYLHQDADDPKSDPDIVPIYENRYNFRMPANQRMDISVRRTLKRASYTVYISGGIYNVYAFQNPYFVYFITRRDRENNKAWLEPRKKSLLPLVPFFNVKFELN